MENYCLNSHEENKTIYSEFELIENHYPQDKKIEILKEEKRKTRNKKRDSCSFEMVSLESDLRKKSEDDSNLISIPRISVAHRENKSLEKDDKNNVNMKIRKTLLLNGDQIHLSKLIFDKIKEEEKSEKDDSLDEENVNKFFC